MVPQVEEEASAVDPARSPEAAPAAARVGPDESPAPARVGPDESPAPARIGPDESPAPARVGPDESPARVGPRDYRVVLPNVAFFLYWHLGALYGLYCAFTTLKWATILMNAALHVMSVWGITAGAHRLWSHRAYRATPPLQTLLMLWHSLAMQSTIIHWVKDHRLHHKYCDTDADPHNASRGFFYSHIGWLLVKKHPKAIDALNTIDFSDLYANPVLQFQKKYHQFLSVSLAFVLPTLIPAWCWGESLGAAYHAALLRFVLTLHLALTVNSAAHILGNKPYDRRVCGTHHNILSLATLGESFHNFHHVFPTDYRTAEFGNNCFNPTTKLIDFFAWVGWAHDLKYADPDVVAKRANRTGDGTDLWGRDKKTFDGNRAPKCT